jgi:hypothetical protein
MLIVAVKFARPSHRDSFGRNRFVQTHGVEIHDWSWICEEGRDGSVMLSPITSRGETSESCRLSLSVSALPEVIAALQGIVASHELAASVDAAPAKHPADGLGEIFTMDEFIQAIRE